MEDTTQAAAPAAATNPADQSAPPNPAPEQEQAAPEGQAAETEGEDEDDADEGQPAKRQSRTARYKATIARQQAEIDSLRRNPGRPVPTKSAAELAGPPPNPAHYATVADYQAARSGWEATRRFIDLDIQNRRADQQAAQAMEMDARAMRYAEKQEDARAELPDYDRVVGAAQMRVSNALAEALVESEHTARLEYHLAKNPKTLAELNRMTPAQAAIAVGRLEAQLSGPQAKRTTQAPAPVSRLNGGSAGPIRSLADLAASDNVNEYAERRKAEINAARR